MKNEKYQIDIYFVRSSHKIFRYDEFEFKKIHKKFILLFKHEITFTK